MKYFCMSLQYAVIVQHEVWSRRGPVFFGLSSVGQDASVWTPDESAEVLFRQVLNELGVRYQEADEQQVVTGWKWF